MPGYSKQSTERKCYKYERVTNPTEKISTEANKVEFVSKFNLTPFKVFIKPSSGGWKTLLQFSSVQSILLSII